MIKVSIIINVYNIEKYLNKCLDSIINQTLKDIEVICINNGSTDNSINILNDYAKKDTRIKILHQKNTSLGYAINKGLENATGEFVGFTDGNSYFDKNYFKQLYDIAKKYDSDLAITSNIMLNNIKPITKEIVYETTKKKFVIFNVKKDNYLANKIYKLELLKSKNIMFSEEVYSENKLFNAKAIFYANKIVTVPNAYYYIQNSKSKPIINNKEYNHAKYLEEIELHQFLEEKRVITTKKNRKSIKGFINNIKLILINKNYDKKIKELQKAYLKRKIKVIFYVTENSKWCYQSLYEIFEKDPYFEPLVLIGVLHGVHKGKDKTRNNLQENYDFFKSRNMNVQYAYKNHKYINLKNFNPDIVFYEQNWELPNIYQPNYVSKFALTCYCPYGLELFYHIDNYTTFNKNLWVDIVDSPLNIERFKTYDKHAEKNCKYLGYPKVDVYFENTTENLTKYWKQPEKIKILYAPHHSFEDKGIRLATFKENGNFILNIAKQHPETTWIFKPHPRFKYALKKNNIMTEGEIEQYYANWEEIGNICTQGDYFDIFKTSDFMITDCCSFLGEYLPTLKPVINPVNQRAIEMNDFGKSIVKNYYRTKNNEELLQIFNQLLENNDNKFVARKEDIKHIFDFNEESAIKILRFIKDNIKRQKND